MEQSCRSVKVGQDTVNDDHLDVPVHDGSIAIPIDIHHYENNTHGSHKVHDFSETSQIIFLLHNSFVFIVNTNVITSVGHDVFSSYVAACDGRLLPLYQ